MPPNGLSKETRRLYNESGLAKCVDDQDINKRRGFIEDIEKLFRVEEELCEEPKNLVLFSKSITEYNFASGGGYIPVGENRELYNKIFHCYPDGTDRIRFRCLFETDISHLHYLFEKEKVATLVECEVEPLDRYIECGHLRSIPRLMYGYHVTGVPIMKKEDLEILLDYRRKHPILSFFK